MARPMRIGRVPAIGLLLLVTACSPIATQSPAPSVGTVDVMRSAPSPGPESTPAPNFAGPVQGWPGTGRNAAGLYSWDGSSCASQYCNVGFMHNGYGSGDVEIRISVVPRRPGSDDGATTVVVAGHDARYREVIAGVEEWIVEVDGTTLDIQLMANPRTSASDMADAHAIIETMRTEPSDNIHGFRLIFTLATSDWDSG